MTPPLVEVASISAGYGRLPAIKEVSFTVQPGERVALLGPNGSGKSTLLRCISRTIRLSSGEIRLNGEAIGGLRQVEVARRVAFVPQEEGGRFPFLVRDVVTLGRMARSGGLMDTPEDRRVAADAMDRADCTHLAERAFTSLSGGERQRVLIARALAQQAGVILLDEPTSHLDPAHQVAVSDLIGSLADTGVGVLAAVHDLNLAARFADRALLLDGGILAMDADVQSVLASPELDRVFKISFTRIPTSDGKVVLLPGLLLV